MKALDDLRATVRTNTEGMTCVTTKKGAMLATVIYTRDEAIQLIGALALSLRNPGVTMEVAWAGRDDEAPDLKQELANGFPKLDTTETGVRPRVSAREHDVTKSFLRQETPVKCNNCGGFTHPNLIKCVNCGKDLK